MELINKPSNNHFKPRSHLGIYHDLGELFEEINRVYFANNIKALISWGKAPPKAIARRVSIQLGSYAPKNKQIIIHPALDQAFVPRPCVAKIVHHEMLHQKHQAIKNGKNNRIHTPAFRAEEKTFKGALAIDKWFHANLERLLRFSSFA